MVIETGADGRSPLRFASALFQLEEVRWWGNNLEVTVRTI